MYSPQKYSQNLQPYVEISHEIFYKHGKLLNWNSEPESILELGVGDGRITNEVILPMVPHNIKEYVGADISEVMLTSARNTIRHDKFKTFQIDGATRNLPAELKTRFDHIFSNNCLHSFQTTDIRQVFKNFHDMLKPGGQLFFHVFEKNFTDDAYDKLQEKWPKYNNRISISPFYFCENPMKEYEKVLKSVGFVDIRICSERYIPRYPEKEFEVFVAALIRRLQFVEEYDKEAYLIDFVEANKKGNMTNIIIDNQNNEKIYETPLDILTAVAFKSA